MAVQPLYDCDQQQLPPFTYVTFSGTVSLIHFTEWGCRLDVSAGRRVFLGQAATGLGLLFLSSITPDLLVRAHAHSESASTKDNFRFLNVTEAADFDAFAAQIIPTDGTPGAREAGVVHFADYVLSDINPEQQAQFREALSELRDLTLKTYSGVASFAALPSAQQIELMKAMEKDSGTPEPARLNQRRARAAHAQDFAVLRGMVILGCFSDPSLGGNKDKVGWKLINFDDQAYWAPPFGYYDAHSEDKS